MGTKQTVKARHRVVKMTPGLRLKQLTEIINCCWPLLQHLDFKEIANKSGLCLSTINRLWNGDYSLDIRFRTVQAFATAAGLEIHIQGSKFDLAFIKE